MTLVQKLDVLCLPNYGRAKTGRRSPFYLNCSHFICDLLTLLATNLLLPLMLKSMKNRPPLPHLLHQK